MNILESQTSVAATEQVGRTRAEHASPRGNFYTWVAVCTFLIIFAGFARTYYLKILFGTRALPLLLHLHGLIFTLWFALFFIQVRLIARHRVDLHRRLGIFGAVLAPLAACVAIAVAFHAERRHYLANPASLTVHSVRPLALDFGSSLTFAFLVAAALCFRRRGDIHKRLMVLASCGLLLPGGRTPYRTHPSPFSSCRRPVEHGRLYRDHPGRVHSIRHHQTPTSASRIRLGWAGAFVVPPRIYDHRQHPCLA